MPRGKAMGHGLALSLASTRVEKKEGDPLMAWHWCATIPLAKRSGLEGQVEDTGSTRR